MTGERRASLGTYHRISFVTKYLSLNISPHPLIFQRPNETINYWTVRVTVPTLRASGDVLFNCHVNSTRYLDRFNQLSKNIQIYIKLPVAGQLAVESRSRRSIKFKFPFSTNFPCCHHHISVQLLCSYDIEPSSWRCQFKLKLAFHQVFTRYLPRCHSLSETIDCWQLWQCHRHGALLMHQVTSATWPPNIQFTLALCLPKICLEAL